MTITLNHTEILKKGWQDLYSCNDSDITKRADSMNTTLNAVIASIHSVLMFTSKWKMLKQYCKLVKRTKPVERMKFITKTLCMEKIV